jgi:hypothetical protein
MAKQKYYNEYRLHYHIYTGREKHCMLYSHNDCRYSGYDKLGSGHVLIGITELKYGRIPALLESVGVNSTNARREVERILEVNTLEINPKNSRIITARKWCRSKVKHSRRRGRHIIDRFRPNPK